MLDRIIAWSLRNRLLVLALAAILMGVGAYTALIMPVDVFPDLTAPTVTVIAEAHGMSPTEVETLVTFPIESALNGASGVRRVRSATAVGISVVWVEFEWGQDIYAARQVVTEKLGLIAGSLPPEVERPILAPISSIMGEILFVAVTSDLDPKTGEPRHDPIEVRTFAETTLRRRLLGIPGISQVTPIGGGEKQYQVILDPAKLRRHGVSLGDVERALARTNENASAGFVAVGGSEYLVEARGRVRSAAEVGQTVVAMREGRPVLLRELGQVGIGEALKRGEASAGAKGAGARNAVILGVQKQPGANTIALTRDIERALDEVERTMPRGYRIDRGIFRQADFIEVSVANVSEALRDGAILVVLVVLLFLANARATGVTLVALPLSLAAAVIVLRALGATINTMTLGGLAIAIGALVDDAIIDVENVVRRLRENGRRPEAERRPALAVVYDASREIRGSIVFATLIIALVFVPLFFLSGVEGRLLRPLGLAYVIALLASLVVALTVTPVLCLLLLPRSKSVARGHEPRLVSALKRGYGFVLRGTLPHPLAIAGVASLLLGLAVFGALRAGRGFLPEFNEGSLTIGAVTLPGTSLAESDRLGRVVEEILLEQPEVTKVARRTGRAELDEHAQGVEAAEIDVSLELGAGRSKEEFLRDLREALSVVPGMNITIGQPISHRIDHMLSGTRANIAVKVFGDDLAKLRDVGEGVRRIMASVPGIVDLSAEPQMEIPFLRVRFDRDAIARHGLTVGEAAEALETAMVGKPVSRVLEGRNAFDLVVRFPDAVRATPESVGEIPIDTPRGGKVPLRTLARVAKEKGPNAISRENVQRKYVVMANVAGRDLKSTVDEVRARVEAAKVVPEGYHVEYGGQFESAASAARTLAVLGIAVVFGILVLLYVALGTARDAVLVMVNLPLALVGGVAAVWLTTRVISIAEVIGFITLFGIATRNGLMLVSHVKHLREVEGEKDFRAAVERGALERLAPILMTALAAGLALVPLVIGGDKPGNEIQRPMAVVILFGLLSSTFLNMVVVPALYLRFGPRGLRRAVVEEEDREVAPGTPRLGGAAIGSLLLAGGLALGAFGCAGADVAPGPHAPPVAATGPASGSTAAGSTREASPRPAPFPSGPLTLGLAEALARERHPALRARAFERDAAAGRARQAGLFPNPRLQLASESNELRDPFSSGEHIAGVFVPIPLGGRLGAAREAAEREVDARRALVLAEEREVIAAVRVAFAAALAAEENVRIARDIADAARGSADFVRKRIAEGEAREADRLRAEVEEARAAVDVETALVARRRALAALAAAVGAPDEDVAGVAGALVLPVSRALGAASPARLVEHPRLKARDAAVAAARADVERLRAERIPDLTIGASYRRIEGEDEDAFDVSAWIDLPLFDRNQGAIEGAERLARAAEAEREVERAALRLALEAALFDLAGASRRAAAYDGDILPKAARSLEIAEAAYREGATSILDVLQARRTLAEASLARLAALREGAEAWARVRSLAGDGAP